MECCLTYSRKDLKLKAENFDSGSEVEYGLLGEVCISASRQEPMKEVSRTGAKYTYDSKLSRISKAASVIGKNDF